MCVYENRLIYLRTGATINRKIKHSHEVHMVHAQQWKCLVCMNVHVPTFYNTSATIKNCIDLHEVHMVHVHEVQVSSMNVHVPTF